MSKPNSWMPMYWRDFWADTTMLNEHEGWAYINLIGAYWMNGGPLPDDDDCLQRAARCQPHIWAKVRTRVLGFFELIDHTSDHAGEHTSGDAGGDAGEGHQWVRHRRVENELKKARELYDARSKNIRAINDRKKGKGLAHTAVHAGVHTSGHTSDPHRRHDNHNHTNSSVRGAASAARPKVSAVKGTRLADDWQPNADERQHANDRGLSAVEIDLMRDHFVRYWTGADAKEPVKRDWARAWKNWVDRNVADVARRGTAGRRAPRDRQGAAGVTDIAARLIAEAERVERLHGLRPGNEDDGLQAAEHDTGATHAGAGDGGVVVEADDAERLFENAQHAQGHDDQAGSAVGSRPGAAAAGLHRAAEPLPGRRGAQSAEHAQHDGQGGEVLADVGRAARPAGAVDTQQAAAQRSAPGAVGDDYGDIPLFMRRPR